MGAGPGLGLSVARRFAEEGYHATLLGQSIEAMEPLAETLRGEGHSADGGGIDLLDAAAVSTTIRDIGERLGRIDVLHFNPSMWREKNPLTLTVDELLDDVMFGAGALLPAVQAAREFMGSGARILVTGSMAADKPGAVGATLGVQKAAVRSLTTSIDKQLKSEGIRAVAVQINGALAREGAFSPTPIAEAMWQAVSRADEDWTAQVGYNG